MKRTSRAGERCTSTVPAGPDGVVTLEGFLNAIQLTRLASSLAERGITRLEELTDEVAEALYVSEPAVKPSQALRLLRQRDRSPMSDEGSNIQQRCCHGGPRHPPMQQQALRLQRRTQPTNVFAVHSLDDHDPGRGSPVSA